MTTGVSLYNINRKFGDKVTFVGPNNTMSINGIVFEYNKDYIIEDCNAYACFLRNPDDRSSRILFDAHFPYWKRKNEHDPFKSITR